MNLKIILHESQLKKLMYCGFIYIKFKPTYDNRKQISSCLEKGVEGGINFKDA